MVRDRRCSMDWERQYVRCLRGSEHSSHIKTGEVYQVLHDIGKSISLVGIEERTWKKDRFEIVTMKDTGVWHVPTPTATRSFQSDPDEHEARVREQMAFFRKSQHEDCCPKCGAPKPCRYH